MPSQTGDVVVGVARQQALQHGGLAGAWRADQHRRHVDVGGRLQRGGGVVEISEIGTATTRPREAADRRHHRPDRRVGLLALEMQHAETLLHARDRSDVGENERLLERAERARARLLHRHHADERHAVGDDERDGASTGHERLAKMQLDLLAGALEIEIELVDQLGQVAAGLGERRRLVGGKEHGVRRQTPIRAQHKPRERLAVHLERS
jgi:hypothetical protein